MEESEGRLACVMFLKELKRKGKSYAGFDESFKILQEFAERGLDDKDIKLLMDVIVHTDLGAVKWVCLVKCLIPKQRMPEEVVKCLMTWCLSSVNELPITVSTIIIQWVVGLWDYQLIDRRVINIYYDLLFYTMLKRDKLERHIARLIYVLTKPEDVTRRNVTRLLTLQKKYSKPQKHIIALLSLFKSYKPELVPEKIQSMNIESVWKPIPEPLRLRLEDAKNRAHVQSSHRKHEYFDWNVTKSSNNRKVQKSLVPSVGYFHIGSSIFKEKDTRSVFDVSNIEELGKYHQSIELPCNAISLLANTAGYHLLMYADFEYQSQFAYNLYNTLIRAFMLENEKFSVEEINKLLDMTIEFSRYMQTGLLIVNLFFDEYLNFNSGEYRLKLFALLEWMISVSVADLEKNILMHIRGIFYESSVQMKCKIIKTFRMLITNLFVNQGYEECCQITPAPFLGQGPMDKLQDVIPVLTKLCEQLIVSGLNIHYYDVLLLSEALLFYEHIYILESKSDTKLWTIAPPAVIFGGFTTKSCAILSRVCSLILRYCERSIQLKQYKQYSNLKDNVSVILIYAQDLVNALYLDVPFSNRQDAYFLKDFPENVIDDLKECSLDSQLNICNHYAILPFKYVLKNAINITSKEDALTIAQCHYPDINKFLTRWCK